METLTNMTIYGQNTNQPQRRPRHNNLEKNRNRNFNNSKQNNRPKTTEKRIDQHPSYRHNSTRPFGNN